MKKSKKLTALIAAVLMTVTMFSSAVPAYADTKRDSGSFICGVYKVNCELNSASNKTANAVSQGSTSIFEYISAYVLGCETNKNGDAVRYLGNTSYGEKTKSSGTAIITLASNSQNRFTNIVSSHYASYASGKYDGGINLDWKYQ